MLQPNPALAIRGKILAWFSVANGIYTIATPFLGTMFANQTQTSFILTYFIALGLVSLVAGIYGLAAKVWAFWLLFIFFFVQMVEYFSPSFYFSFIGPLSLKIGWGTISPPSHTNFNILAFIACGLAYKTARTLSGKYDD